MKFTGTRGYQGFTIPEIVVVIAVVLVCILASLVFIHPRDYNVQDRNAKRTLQLAYVSQGLTRYYNDIGHLPADITGTATIIGSDTESYINLCADLVPKYLKDIPVDPLSGQMFTDTCAGNKDQPGAYNAQYTIMQQKDGTIVLAAPRAEAGANIQLSHKY